MTDFAFHHLGVACCDLDEDEQLYAVLGYVRERDEVVDELQGVRARFLVGPGPRIELIADLADGTLVRDSCKRGVKLHHTAFEVPDLGAASERLVRAGGRAMGAPLPGIAFGMRELAFIMLPTMQLVELITAPPAPSR